MAAAVASSIATLQCTPVIGRVLATPKTGRSALPLSRSTAAGHARRHRSSTAAAARPVRAVLAPDAPSSSPSSSSSSTITRRRASALDGPHEVRHDWTREEVAQVYWTPMMDLLYAGATAHRQHFNPREVQQCTLLSIKTGGCPETCSYCSQSSHYETSVKAEPLMKVEEVLENARKAKEAGSTRFCMGAAWREVSQVSDAQFDRVLAMVSGVRDVGLEVCATLGMLTPTQAERLKEAGLTAYNHNLDTSREFYPEVVSSRTYEDRLTTLAAVRGAGISVCCGGILGLGESHEDRVGLLHTLATLPAHPESVPVNALVPNPGTPLEDVQPLPVFDLIRMIATARILMPKSMVRLSAGRLSLTVAEQALCFFTGANSIFTGDKLLTTPNPAFNEDAAMFELLGLSGKAPFFYETEYDKDAAQAPAANGCGPKC
eukprot:jgi/Chlat1/1054/Chrsp110S01536